MGRRLSWLHRPLVVRQNSNEGLKSVKQPATGLFHTFQLSSVGPLALGIAGAAVFFSWALATPASPPDSGNAGSAGVQSSPLQLSNPFLAAGVSPQFPSGGQIGADGNGFDAGDACSGASVDRSLTALDGIAPYTFTTTTAGSFNLSLNSAGRLTGVMNAAAGPLSYFTASVKDSTGAVRTGSYFLNAPNCSTFHFAQGSVSQARVGEDFITKIDVIDPPGPVAFAIVPGSVSLNGVPQSSLSAAGFQLFPDGVLAGRPLASGSVTFTASAVSNGAHALNRSGASPDASFTLNVMPQTQVQSVMATGHLAIHGGQPGRDWLDLSTYLNTGGLPARAFAGAPLTLRLGAQVFTATFGARARNPDITANVNNAMGLLHVRMRNQDFSKLLQGPIPDNSTQDIVVQLSLGATVQGVEILECQSRNRAGRFQLTYDLARNRPLGGLFQIVSLQGVNFFGQLAFLVKFIITPVGGEMVQASQSAVSIGPGFTQTFPLSRGQSFNSAGPIQFFAAPPRTHVGTVLTNALNPSSVGISPTATGQPQPFLMRVDLSGAGAPLSGVCSDIIGPNFSFPVFIPVIIIDGGGDGGGDFIDGGGGGGGGDCGCGDGGDGGGFKYVQPKGNGHQKRR